MKILKPVHINSKLTTASRDILCKILWVPFGRYLNTYDITNATQVRRAVEPSVWNFTQHCLKLKLKSYEF
jgi:hypothetical protein